MSIRLFLYYNTFLLKSKPFIIKAYWLAMQGMTMPALILLIILLLVTYIFTLCEDIIESKRGGTCMKKIMHTRLNAKMLAKAMIKNLLIICRSTASSALSANTLQLIKQTAERPLPQRFSHYSNLTPARHVSHNQRL